MPPLLGVEYIALAGALLGHLLLSDSPLSALGVFRDNLAGSLCLPNNERR
jgi:hypothetical protein